MYFSFCQIIVLSAFINSIITLSPEKSLIHACLMEKPFKNVFGKGGYAMKHFPRSHCPCHRQKSSFELDAM